MPARVKVQSSALSQGTDFPELKADALSNLTARIADKLKKPAVEAKANNKLAKARPERGERKQGQSDQSSLTVEKEQNGKKRLRDGQLKEPRSTEINTNGPKTTSRRDRIGPASRPRIEEEILALGGSKEDLDLVADVASQSEVEGDEPTKAHRNSLKKDLMKFVQDIGIQTVNYEASDSEDREGPDHAMPDAGTGNSAAITPAGREKSIAPVKLSARGSLGLVRHPINRALLAEI